MANFTRKEMRRRRRWRIRKKISGTRSEPRMAVCASGKHLYVQFIDDENGHTLASASTLDSQLRKDNLSANVHGAEIIGRTAAERALAAGIKKVVFDRGGFLYHGVVKAVADGAREAGLNF